MEAVSRARYGGISDMALELMPQLTSFTIGSTTLIAQINPLDLTKIKNPSLTLKKRLIESW